MRLLAIMMSVITFAAISQAAAVEIRSSVNPATLKTSKTISTKRYLTSQDAYQLLTENPEVVFIDVRDPVEISLSGRPEFLDAVVPVKIQSVEFDSSIEQFVLKDNPDFLDQMKVVMKRERKAKDDLIIVTCGSGMRSAIAAQQLIDAGYTNVWHIPDGYDGDDRPGINTKNAWRLAGLPWTNAPVFGDEWRLILD